MPRTRGHLGNEDRFFAPKRAVPRASGSLSLEDRAGFPSGCVSFLQQLFTDDLFNKDPLKHWNIFPESQDTLVANRG